MGTTLHSFVDIFETEFQTEKDPVKLKEIVIPIIQRDYAQGRKNPDVDRVRSRFLDSLYDAVTKQPITLDFVYGDIDENGVMTPLDGQQRLTTLFLLHWYAAKKGKVDEAECSMLCNFSYKTRYSARYFCEELVIYNPSFKEKLSKEIVNQSWFPLDWLKDPTISSMLVMLDSIDKRFSDVPNLWESLKGNAITFYFLPIKDMGLTDELYIKMNSRGKPLTQFEHFKAELERNIRAIDEKTADRILSKIDREWTDLLWRYRNSGSGNDDDNIIDDEFLRYFRFICDVICYKGGASPQGKRNDEFSLLERYFSTACDKFEENVSTLEHFFDCWCSVPGFDSPKAFQESVMAYGHENGKVIVDKGRYKVDIFEDCLQSYFDRFPLNRFVLLYAVVTYLQNTEKVTIGNFARRLRIVNNLLQNSEDEVTDRAGRNRIPAVLAQTEYIIINGTIDNTIENSFNTNQLSEEAEKIEYLSKNPDKAEVLFSLEDHPMLKGQISIVGLENLDYANRFESLFKCQWDKIDCALMATGNYGQSWKWRHQYASSGMQYAWDELFHKSANSGFENTKKILIDLLSTNESFTNDILSGIAKSFISECETNNLFPWRYYYIKYPIYRPGSYGKLSNSEPDTRPYMFSVMQTKTQWSENTYMPYLKAADETHLSRDAYGQRLSYPDKYITCENASYIVKKNDDDSVIEELIIAQDENGIDVEDRIVKLKEYIKSI